MADEEVNESPFLLKNLIRQVRQELVEAAKERTERNEDPVLALQSVTLEINFVVETEKRVAAGAKAKLLAVAGFSVEGEQKYTREQVHKVTVQLSGVLPSLPESLGAEQTARVVEKDQSVKPGISPGASTPASSLIFENIFIKGSVGGEIRSIPVKDLLDEACKFKPFDTTGHAEPIMLDFGDLLKSFGHKLK